MFSNSSSESESKVGFFEVVPSFSVEFSVLEFSDVPESTDGFLRLRINGEFKKDLKS